MSLIQSARHAAEELLAIGAGLPADVEARMIGRAIRNLALGRKLRAEGIAAGTFIDNGGTLFEDMAARADAALLAHSIETHVAR